MATESKTVVQGFYDRALSGDMPAMLALIDPDVRIIEAESLPYGGITTGTDGLLKLFGTVFSVWKDCQITLKALLADGECVVALTEMTGSGATSGRPFRMDLAEVFRVRNGKIVEIKPFYFDTKLLHDIHTG